MIPIPKFDSGYNMDMLVRMYNCEWYCIIKHIINFDNYLLLKVKYYNGVKFLYVINLILVIIMVNMDLLIVVSILLSWEPWYQMCLYHIITISKS